ncbi:hypothetical protein BX600DRAFT_479140 [Xylariales sp. PMI_506]|nr:hypothetical protein BX600DRAFT_479140 [Xylariales sp. PMI_506]
MRLIDVNTLRLEEYSSSQTLDYAILSDTWGENEINYQEWQRLKKTSRKQGYHKILGAYKTSSAELSEAINSMFSWYQKAKVCYVYLADVADLASDSDTDYSLNNADSTKLSPNDYLKSRWFARGWTLQELLTPRSVIFYSSSWKVLEDYHHGIRLAAIAERMSWLSSRTTTRIEDMAYCMLGIFDINMPLLYGEGYKAFLRLQEELIKTSNDQSIFCWSMPTPGELDPDIPKPWTGILAPQAAAFRYSARYHQLDGGVSTYTITNAGLSIELPVGLYPTLQ